MRTDNARKLTTASPIFYFDLLRVHRYVANVTSATPQQVQISVPALALSLTFPLSYNDNAAELPIYLLT